MTASTSRISFAACIVLASLLLGIGMGFIMGLEKGRRNAAVAEVKGLRAILLMSKEHPEPKAVRSEFVLARYYEMVVELDPDLRKGLVEDFGPVQTSLLSGMPINKGPVDFDNTYNRLIRAQ